MEFRGKGPYDTPAQYKVPGGEWAPVGGPQIVNHGGGCCGMSLSQ